MKTVLIVFAALGAVFLIFQIYSMASNSKIESYPYKVIKDLGEIEIREYEKSLFTSVKLAEGNYNKASSKGFSILAGYIFGGNERKEKIAMTSPVSMSLEDSMDMMFMVPKEYKKEDLPKPDRSDIEFKEVPAKTMAAISFGGWANDEKIASYKEELKKVLDANGIDYTNRFYFYGYNAPYDMINRRNEVLVELENPGA